MRYIIDGKRYDTEKAEAVGSFANGSDTSNFEFFEETLYLTAKGAWFLVGSGHARSPYGKMYHYNTWGWGSSVRILTPESTQAWLEEQQLVDALEQHFGASITDA